MFLAKISKIFFHLRFIIFTVFKNHSILHRHVCVMEKDKTSMHCEKAVFYVSYYDMIKVPTVMESFINFPQKHDQQRATLMVVS